MENYQGLKTLRDAATAGLDAYQTQAVEHMLRDNKAVFSNDSGDLGKTDLVQHEIQTGDTKPIKQAPRRIPIHRRELVAELVAEMKTKGVIEDSSSPWASPIVLVQKKDGSLRFCVDYRRLNAVTEKDAYPLPRIDDTIEAFSGAQWFSTLDLTSGFWQVGLTEEAKKKTAFCIPGGLYQFKVLSFGLCNAPGTFERLMESVLAGLPWKTCLVYIDDVIIFSKTFEQHVADVEEVLERLGKAGMKLKAKKCEMFRPEVTFLGHVVGRDGVRTDTQKTEAVRKWTQPKDVSELRSFLGLCAYYRRFVERFAEKAAPLYQLTEKKNPFIWKAEQEAAFRELKDRLITSPILGYPQPEGRYILDTDASDTGLGAVLSQEQDGAERVIAYLSRSMSKEERRYCVTRKELLAVVFAAKKSRHYLLGKKFLLRTDHGSLTWLMNFKEPQGQVARWIEALSEFQFDIKHRPGRIHNNADALSRSP